MALQAVIKSGVHINTVSRDQMQEFQPIKLTGQTHHLPSTQPPPAAQNGFFSRKCEFRDYNYMVSKAMNNNHKSTLCSYFTKYITF